MSGHEISMPTSPSFGWAAVFLGDEYVWKARKAPVFLVAFPAFAVAGAWVPTFHIWATIPAGVGCLLLGLCGHIGRIRGKAGEESLFVQWGGKPTTRMLRHGESPLAAQKLLMTHAKLAGMTGVAAPSAKDERKKPDDADKIYESYVTYLRNATRKGDEFPLLRQELVNYGFARNVWGLRPFGIGSSLLAVSATAARLWWLWKSSSTSGYEVALAWLVVSLISFVFWAFWARETWVKQIADEYAKRLLEAADSLPEKNST